MRGHPRSNAAMPVPIRAVIFDFDGLIVDTESIGYQTWKEIFDAEGHDLPVERYAQVIGTDFNTAYNPRHDLEERAAKVFDWELMELQRRARETELRTTLRVLPGVIERLAEARALNLKTAVASSSPLSWIAPWLEELQLRDHFHHVTTVDDTGKVKPDPSLFVHAAEKLGIHPDEALIFEDSLNGLRAATAAGMRCIVIPGPMTRHLDFSGAFRQVNSLLEVSLAELV